MYPFIRLILIQITPENLLSQFERRYDSTRFREEAESAEKVSNHPMQPVYDFARNAMRRGDYNAAIAAVDVLYGLPKQLLPELVKMDDLDIEPVFEPILNNYGESIIKKADSNEYYDIISSASNGMSELGEESIYLSDKRVFSKVFSTNYSLLEENFQFDEETHLLLLDCCSNLYSSAASNKDILQQYIPQQSQLVTIVVDRDSVNQLEKCLNGIVDAHNTYISTTSSSSSENRFEKVLIGYKERQPAWNRTENDDPLVFTKCMFLLMQATGAVFSILDETTPPGFIYQGWESAIRESYNNDLNVHLKVLIRRYVELVAYIELNYESGLSASNRISKIIDNEGLRDSVLSSCDSILDEERSLSDMNNFQFLEQNLPMVWNPIPLVEYSDEFISNVEDIKSDVQNHKFK